MERQIEFELAGQKYTLLYTVRVMLDVMARYGSEEKLLDAILKQDAEGVAASVWLFLREAEEGNGYRAARGRAPYALPEPELLPFELTTEEYVQLQRAAMEAFSAGHRREVENEETEEDVGLAEFEKKTAPARRRPM